MVEQQKYSVVAEIPGDIEIRDYPEHYRISVDVVGDLSEAGNIGFRPLVNYISGFNATSQSIAMTAPVLQSPQDSSHHVVSFVLPDSPHSGSWPVAKDPRVRVEARPACLVAARRFRGYWRESLVRAQQGELLGALASTAHRPIGEPFLPDTIRRQRQGSCVETRFLLKWKEPEAATRASGCHGWGQRHRESRGEESARPEYKSISD